MKKHVEKSIDKNGNMPLCQGSEVHHRYISRILSLLCTCVALMLVFCSMLVSCGDDNTDPNAGKHKVRVSCELGAGVVGDSIIYVGDGEDAVFDIKIDDGYAFDHVSSGRYDPATGKLTVSAVRSDMNIDLFVDKVENVRYDVKLKLGDFVSTVGSDSTTVGYNGEASFRLSFADGYVFGSSSVGVYDENSGVLTVSGVACETEVEVIAARLCNVRVVAGNDVLHSETVKVSVGSSTAVSYAIGRGYELLSCEGCSYSAGNIGGIGGGDAVITLGRLADYGVTIADGAFTVGDIYAGGVKISAQNISGGIRIKVYKGETLTVSLTQSDGHVITGTDVGSWSAGTGVLTLSNIGDDINVTVMTATVGEEQGRTFVYSFHGVHADDTSSLSSDDGVRGGTDVHLYAGDYSRIFLGWSVGKTLTRGGDLLGTSRSLVFTISSAIADDRGAVVVYANYTDADTVRYDTNGGTVNDTTGNIDSSKYYSVSIKDNIVSVKYSEKYLAFMEAACSFYDDGTFTRDGYVLREYNTKADGSGTAYSLGSKVPLLDGSAGYPTLYCIWERETDHSDFTYDSYTLSKPYASLDAPNWVENGIIITSYKGDDDTVVIPESIGGRAVTAIAAGAFKDKKMSTLVMGRRMLRVEDGAFVGCTSLETIYFPDGMYSMGNDALDSASYSSLTHLYVNATLAPRFLYADSGALSVKLSRLITDMNQPMIIVIAGSSSYQGLGTEYMEALLGGEYRVINFGTTRTTNGIIYLEAMSHFASEDDIIIYAPENSSYMMGETELYWKTLRDLESMNNFYRYIDISNYSNVFGAFTEFNKEYRYTKGYSAGCYEQICENGSLSRADGTYPSGTTNKYGDYLYDRRNTLGNYIDAYFVTLNEYMKSKDEGAWNNVGDQESNKDYTDPNNKTWANITDAYFRDAMNMAIASAKSSGTKVYFGFCPVDSSALVDGADSSEWLTAYEKMILDNFDFDGLMGTVGDYIWDHDYFFDCAFHLNDVGRTFRTYRLYLDICSKLGISDTTGFTEVGTDFDGCIFESGSDGSPTISRTPKN